MAILPWPTDVPQPNDLTLGQIANTRSGGRSPFDGTEQTLRMPGERWAAELHFRDLEHAQWRALLAFVTSLSGRAGRFTWSPIAKFPRQGNAGGTHLVKGAGQTGAGLLTDGWLGGVSAAITGDLIGYLDPTGRSMMHMATANALPSGGEATIYLSPVIRRSPADNTALNLVDPSPVWRLARDDNFSDLTPGERGFAMSLSIEETIW